MFKNLAKKLSFTALAYFIILSAFVFIPQENLLAQQADPLYKPIYFTPQIEIPNSSISGQVPVGQPGADGFIRSDLLSNYIQAIYNYGLSIGGVLAAVMLMAGGLMWLVSGGDSGKISKAKTLITGSLVGLLILFGTYLILNTINPELVKMEGVRVLGIKPQLGNAIVTCCDAKLGLISMQVKDANGKMTITVDDPKIGAVKGEEFTTCENFNKSVTCNIDQGASCSFDRHAKKQYLCTDPAKICCTCTMGTTFGGYNKYNECKENISKTECQQFCEDRLVLYNAVNGENYKLYDLSNDSGFGRINPSVYECVVPQGFPKGEICAYTR